MKRNDLFFLFFVFILFFPFYIYSDIYNLYLKLNKEHGIIMSFVKFAILATMGEVLALRLKTGKYNKSGFGLIPRALIWGLLGITIKIAMTIFASGTPVFLKYIGISNAPEILKGAFSGSKILVSFSISVAMNLIYAPVLMTLHKITDTHIDQNNGKIACLWQPVKFGEIMKNMNWEIQWNFVFKKTIPFFWIPAHTITFLLPEEFQVLFAALLGIMLGVLLALASIKSKK